MYILPESSLPESTKIEMKVVDREPVPAAHYALGIFPRQDNQTQSSQSPSGQTPPTGLHAWNIIIIVIIAVVGVVSALLSVYYFLRRLRLQGKEPRFLPRSFKKKWNEWKPKGKYTTIGDEVVSVNDTCAQGQVLEINAGVDRHLSVRSIITLPAYSKSPRQYEEIIGREGERAGMDTVVEYPETAEQEEERRDEEMESLFQIRQARRQENADRDERRRLRREAREAGDLARLDELRRESRRRRDERNQGLTNDSTGNVTAETLIAEHNSRGREKKISSVAYASVGQVRHDGSRIRATSRDSERGGLLSGAAPMGGVPPLPYSRHGSDSISMLSTADILQPRHRNRANSGGTSFSSLNSSFDNISRLDVRPETSGTNAISLQATRSNSSLESAEVDIVEQRVQPEPVAPGSSPLPPTYDAIEWGDAPAYTEQERIARMSSTTATYSLASRSSRATTTLRIPSMAPRRPSLRTMPTINIESPTSPR